MKPITLIWIALGGTLIGLVIYYFFPYAPLPKGITIDKIVVFKSQRKLFAYSQGILIKTFTISLGKNPVGTKVYEGDFKTPEGAYTINDKNPNSTFHKSLGISYPNLQDFAHAKQSRQPPGGDIKIHGLRNDQWYLGRFQRWKDWTTGCIALTNQEIDDLYLHTPLGVSIEIEK
jgi:murein L,D-transpeptidase YafK